MKLSHFCTSKETVRNLQNGKELFARYISDKRLISSRIHKGGDLRNNEINGQMNKQFSKDKI